MSRIQLINVTDVDSGPSRLRGLRHPRAKRKDGYANFEIAEPLLKLVLIESAEGAPQPPRRETTAPRSPRRPDCRARTQTTGVDDTTCRYATKTETWHPDGAVGVVRQTGDAEDVPTADIRHGARRRSEGLTEVETAPTGAAPVSCC